MYKKPKQLDALEDTQGKITEIVPLNTDEEQQVHSKRKKKYMPSSYPWEAIEQFFVEGAPDKAGKIYYPTLYDLVDHYQVSYSHVRKRMIEGNWMQKRTAWQLALQKQIQKQSFLDYIAAADKFDATCIETAQLALDEIYHYFLEAKASGEQISNLDLDRLGRAATNWQRVGRLSLGLSTDNQASRIETKNGDVLSALDLSKLDNDEIASLKELLQRSQERNDAIEGQVEEIIEDTEGSLIS